MGAILGPIHCALAVLSFTLDEGGPALEDILAVLDYGRPSISGVVEMYPEEQGFGPSTLRCSE